MSTDLWPSYALSNVLSGYARWGKRTKTKQNCLAIVSLLKKNEISLPDDEDYTHLNFAITISDQVREKVFL